MRILFINDYQSAGGKEKYLHGIRKSLRAAGHVTALLYSAHLPEEIGREEITFCMPGIDTYRGTMRTIARLRDCLTLFKPDVVHLNHNLRNLLAANWLIRRFPTLRSVHDVAYLCPTRYYLRADTHSQCDERCGAVCFSAGCVSLSRPRSLIQLIQTRLAQQLYGRCGALNTQSEYLGRHLRKTIQDSTTVNVLPVFAAPIRDVQPHIEIPAHFLFVGRLHHMKGPQTAIEAISYLPDSTTLELVGTGDQEAELQSLVRSLKLTNRIQFTGYLTGDALAERYTQALAVLVPSLMPENCPISVLDAMAASLPVIATRTGGIPELVDDGITGFLVPPGNARALSVAMKRLCDSPDLARLLGENGHTKIKNEKYRSDNHIRELVHLYEATIISFQTHQHIK